MFQYEIRIQFLVGDFLKTARPEEARKGCLEGFRAQQKSFLQNNAFVSLFVLQALVFITGFCGTILYKVQRMSSAQQSRVQALSDRSLLKALYPVVLTELTNLHASSEIHSVLTTVTINDVSKKLLATCTQKNEYEKVITLSVVTDKMQVRSSMYLFFTKSGAAWEHRGVQFGSSL